MKIKLELLHTDDQNQSQVETDGNNSSEDESNQKRSQKKKKTRRTEEVEATGIKRNSSSELLTKSKRTRLNEDSMVASNSSSKIEIQNPSIKDDEVAKLKRLINDLSNESIKNPKNVRNTLESIIGKEAVSALSTILVNSPQPKDGNENNIAIESLESGREKNEGKSNTDISQSLGKSSEEVISNLSPKRGKKNESKQKGRKSEIDKLNEDIADSFIFNEVVAAKGPRLKTRKQYEEDDLIQDELYDCECSNYSKNEDSEEDFEQDAVNTNFATQNRYIKCYVEIEKLDIEGLKMPVTILKDGGIDRSPISKLELQNDLRPLDEPQKNQKFTATASSDVSLSGKIPTREQVITIEEDIPERNLQISNATKKKINNLKSQETETSLLSPLSKVVALSENKVSNLSFVRCRSGTKLKCCTEKCNYECYYESHEQIFKYHIQTQHILSKWCGSCKLCDSSVSGFGSLLDEYYHMNDVHIKGNASASKKVTTNSDGTEGSNKERGRRKQLKRTDNLDEIGTTNTKASHIEHNKSIQNTEASQKSADLRTDIVQVSRKVSNKIAVTDKAHVISSQDKNIATEVLPLAPLQFKETLSQSSLTNGAFKNFTVQQTPPPINLASNCVPLRPTIKLRVLPGDKLSSVNTQTVNSFSSPRNAFVPSSNKLAVVPKTATTIPNLSIPTVQIVNERLTISLNSLKTFKVYVPNSSNSSQQRPVQPSTSSNQFVISSVSSLVQQGAATPEAETKALTIVSSPIQKRLRPWLLVGDLKHTQNISRMLTTECLQDMYKCMGSVCNFHSNDVNDFLSHLKWHETCQITDSNHYRRCCYCNFTSDGIVPLTEHIQEIHKYDKYSCTKCFYRSVNEVYVYNHQSYHHKDLSRKLIECQVSEPINYRTAIDEVKKIRSKFIQPISCAGKL